MIVLRQADTGLHGDSLVLLYRIGFCPHDTKAPTKMLRLHFTQLVDANKL
ncbi:hypothetical protein N9Z64_00075 [bacterium]|nr:hypothetical protein [bacterium]